jgi:hypothetical protein
VSRALDWLSRLYWRDAPRRGVEAALLDTARALSKRPLPPLTTTWSADA